MQPTPPPPAAERRAAAMGTAVHVIVVGGAGGLADRALARIADLEQRWSRFLPSSEISLLNRRPGVGVEVSAETRLLVTCAVLGWNRSAGLFDPTVHDALVSAGYDADFAQVASGAPAAGRGVPTPGCVGVTIDDQRGTVQLPEGVRFDPGGIGKGLAADLVVDELLSDGAVGVCVNLGGDLRVAGESPDGGTWRIAVSHPHGAAASAASPWGVLDLAEGAVATSGTDRRRWGTSGRMAHHLIDPATGLPARRSTILATAVAATGWEAEVAAKVALLLEPGTMASTSDLLAYGAVLFDASGTATTVGSLPVHRLPAGV